MYWLTATTSPHLPSSKTLPLQPLDHLEEAVLHVGQGQVLGCAHSHVYS
jgi:hypothetical protein